MSELHPVIIHMLTDLFLACGGEAGQFYPVEENDLPVYEDLLRYRLVTMESDEDDQGIHWTAALTEDGRRFFLEYNRLEEQDLAKLPRRATISLAFNLRDEAEHAIYQQLQELEESNSLLPTLARLLIVQNTLETDDIQTFEALYPDFMESLRKKLAKEHAKQDQHQLTQLLEEMEAVKKLLSQPQGQAQPAPLRPLIGLTPVIPQTPSDGAPKRLQVPKFEVPIYDDESESSELFVVQADLEAGKKAAENFLNSLKSLQNE